MAPSMARTRPSPSAPAPTQPAMPQITGLDSRAAELSNASSGSAAPNDDAPSRFGRARRAADRHAPRRVQRGGGDAVTLSSPSPRRGGVGDGDVSTSPRLPDARGVDGDDDVRAASARRRRVGGDGDDVVRSAALPRLSRRDDGGDGEPARRPRPENKTPWPSGRKRPQGRSSWRVSSSHSVQSNSYHACATRPCRCFNTMGTRSGKSSLIKPGPNSSAHAA